MKRAEELLAWMHSDYTDLLKGIVKGSVQIISDTLEISTQI